MSFTSSLEVLSESFFGNLPQELYQVIALELYNSDLTNFFLIFSGTQLVSMDDQFWKIKCRKDFEYSDVVKRYYEKDDWYSLYKELHKMKNLKIVDLYKTYNISPYWEVPFNKNMDNCPIVYKSLISVFEPDLPPENKILLMILASKSYIWVLEFLMTEIISNMEFEITDESDQVGDQVEEEEEKIYKEDCYVYIFLGGLIGQKYEVLDWLDQKYEISRLVDRFNKWLEFPDNLTMILKQFEIKDYVSEIREEPLLTLGKLSGVKWMIEHDVDPDILEIDASELYESPELYNFPYIKIHPKFL